MGLPVGVNPQASYRSTTVSVPRAATFLAYTDGLIERRDENIDQGLARLRAAAAGEHADLSELLGRVLRDMRNGPAEDDTAIVGLRWAT